MYLRSPDILNNYTDLISVCLYSETITGIPVYKFLVYQKFRYGNDIIFVILKISVWHIVWMIVFDIPYRTNHKYSKVSIPMEQKKSTEHRIEIYD